VRTVAQPWTAAVVLSGTDCGKKTDSVFVGFLVSLGMVRFEL
jgi:hypothetical protein